jgi:hypothetical protein
MLRPWVGALILAIAVTGSAAVLAARLGKGGQGPDAASEVRMRELDALLQVTRQTSTLCTSTPSKTSNAMNR